MRDEKQKKSKFSRFIPTKKSLGLAPPKRALGQNFLRNNVVAKKLVDSAHIVPEDIVLEVGPGKGAVTEFLLAQAKKVIAVEKDGALVDFLKERFFADIASGKLVLVHDDILSFNPRAYCLEPRAYVLVGAIPYNITGAFLKYFLQKVATVPKTISLIIQKEVAERIVARNKKESMLSISIKAYGKPRYVETIKPGNFTPSPKVDSAIVTIEDISKDFFSENDISEEEFFKLVRAGFAHKRKFLSPLQHDLLNMICD